MEENHKKEKVSQISKLTKKLNKLNKTPLLIAGLVILTGVLLALSLNSKKSSLPPDSKEVKRDFAKTSLTISDDVRVSTVSGTYEVDINIDTGDNLVTGAQIELTYDPEILTDLDINQGDFLTEPQIILKDIDNQTGRASFVLGIRPEQQAVSGTGVIAVVSFSKTGTEPASINFLPQTLISAEGFDQSVLKETVSGVIGELPE